MDFMSGECYWKQPLNNHNPDTIIDYYTPSRSAVQIKNVEEDYRMEGSEAENDGITLTPVVPNIPQPLTSYPYEGYPTSQQQVTVLQNYYSPEVIGQHHRVNLLLDSFTVNYSKLCPIEMGHNAIIESEGGEYLRQNYGVVGSHAMTPTVALIYNPSELPHPLQLPSLQIHTPTALPLAPSPSMNPSKNNNRGKHGERTKVNRVRGGGAEVVAKVRRVRKERSLYNCSVCNKRFRDNYSLDMHTRTHTGEKPFTCPRCGRKFRQKPHLAKHYRTHVNKRAVMAAHNVPEMIPQIPMLAKETNSNPQCIEEKAELLK